MKLKFRIVFLALILSNCVGVGSANAEECKKYDPSTIFAWGFEKDYPTWTKAGKTRVIRWTALEPGDSLNGKSIRSSFGSQIDWLKEAFDSWDQALDSVVFLQVPPTESADIKVGYTNILELDYVSYFNVWPDIVNPENAGLRARATIEFKYDAPFLYLKQNFMQSAQFEIGRILGLGYINPKNDIVSIMEFPWQAPYMQVPLSEYDVGLIRSIYGESTCPSSFPDLFKAYAKLKSLSDEITRMTEEITNLKKENTSYRERVLVLETNILALESQFKTEVGLSQDARNSLESQLADAKKKIIAVNAELAKWKPSTITCIKGKIKKKITAIKPKCPAGFKRL